VFSVHKNTLEPFNPTHGARVTPGGDSYTLHYCPIREGSPPGWGAAHPNKKGVAPEDRHQLIVFMGFPAFFGVCAHNWLWWMSIQPHGVDRVAVRYGGCVTPEVLEDPTLGHFAQELAQFLAIANSEDKVALERVMRGMRGPLTRRGRLGPLDRPLWEFSRFLDRYYQDLIRARESAQEKLQS
jgi:hypothetical protein